MSHHPTCAHRQRTVRLRRGPRIRAGRPADAGATLRLAARALPGPSPRTPAGLDFQPPAFEARGSRAEPDPQPRRADPASPAFEARVRAEPGRRREGGAGRAARRARPRGGGRAGPCGRRPAAQARAPTRRDRRTAATPSTPSTSAPAPAAHGTPAPSASAATSCRHGLRLRLRVAARAALLRRTQSRELVRVRGARTRALVGGERGARRLPTARIASASSGSTRVPLVDVPGVDLRFAEYRAAGELLGCPAVCTGTRHRRWRC